MSIASSTYFRSFPQKFGTEILTDERLNKPKLAQIVFNDEKKLNENIQKIQEILKTFGETNEMTEKLSTCKDCQYALLCNRA